MTGNGIRTCPVMNVFRCTLQSRRMLKFQKKKKKIAKALTNPPLRRNKQVADLLDDLLVCLFVPSTDDLLEDVNAMLNFIFLYFIT